jgi:hypothetical protein
MIARSVAALNVNPNATAVARQVGGVSGVGVWKIAQVEGDTSDLLMPI